MTVYSNLDGGKAKQATLAAFLDDSHIVFGSEKGVKGIIDVHQKKAESLIKNAEVTGILKNVDKYGLALGGFRHPPGAHHEGHRGQPPAQGPRGDHGVTVAMTTG